MLQDAWQLLRGFTRAAPALRRTEKVLLQSAITRTSKRDRTELQGVQECRQRFCPDFSLFPLAWRNGMKGNSHQAIAEDRGDLTISA